MNFIYDIDTRSKIILKEKIACSQLNILDLVSDYQLIVSVCIWNQLNFEKSLKMFENVFVCVDPKSVLLEKFE